MLTRNLIEPFHGKGKLRQRGVVQCSFVSKILLQIFRNPLNHGLAELFSFGFYKMIFLWAIQQSCSLVDFPVDIADEMNYIAMSSLVIRDIVLSHTQHCMF